MRARPMIDAWAPPGIEAVDAWEVRRLARLPVPGLAGDLHHDMGRGALSVRLIGSLSSDEARDPSSKNYGRATTPASRSISSPTSRLSPSSNESSSCISTCRSRPARSATTSCCGKYVEPPEPPGLDLGLDDLDLSLDIDLGLDLLDLAGLLDVPEIGPLLEPVKAAADELGQALQSVGEILSPLDDLLGE